MTMPLHRSPRLAALFFVMGAGGLCAAALYNSSSNSAPQTALALEQELKMAVTQLQQNPANRTLREHIIKLAQPMKLQVPGEARQHFDRGLSLSKKKDEQTKIAAAEFRKAVRVAPWWGDAYYELGIVLEARGRHPAASRAFELYLVAAPDGVHNSVVREKLRTLESAVLYNQTSCIECGVHCTPNGIACCKDCYCDSYEAPSGQTFWKCFEDW